VPAESLRRIAACDDHSWPSQCEAIDFDRTNGIRKEAFRASCVACVSWADTRACTIGVRVTAILGYVWAISATFWRGAKLTLTERVARADWVVLTVASAATSRLRWGWLWSRGGFGILRCAWARDRSVVEFGARPATQLDNQKGHRCEWAKGHAVERAHAPTIPQLVALDEKSQRKWAMPETRTPTRRCFRLAGVLGHTRSPPKRTPT
jgi:hypothetical protein